MPDSVATQTCDRQPAKVSPGSAWSSALSASYWSVVIPGSDAFMKIAI